MKKNFKYEIKVNSMFLLQFLNSNLDKMSKDIIYFKLT